MTDTDIDMAIARERWKRRLRHMREHSGPDRGFVSRWEFANLVGGFSPSSVEAWETKGTIPSGETIIRLAAHLPEGWTLEYLLGVTATLPGGVGAGDDIQDATAALQDASTSPDSDDATQPASKRRRRAPGGQP